MENSKEKVIADIEAMEELDARTKADLIGRLNAGEIPIVILSEIDDLLQKQIDGIFNEEGITLDENSSEYKAEHQKMMDGLQEAEDVFNKEMHEIEQESEQIHKETSAQLDQIKKEEIMEKLAQKEE